MLVMEVVMLLVDSVVKSCWWVRLFAVLVLTLVNRESMEVRASVQVRCFAPGRLARGR